MPFCHSEECAGNLIFAASTMWITSIGSIWLNYAGEDSIVTQRKNLNGDSFTNLRIWTIIVCSGNDTQPQTQTHAQRQKTSL